METANIVATLKKAAALFGIDIQPAEAADEFVLINREGEAIGNGDEDWTVRDIHGYLSELCWHPEAKGMVVV